jgi:HEPN domain-containing protein
MPEEGTQVSREHLRAAELLLKEGLYHLACFHAQRAAAQALQAMLDRNGMRSPCGGTLLARLNACAAFDAELLSLRASCALLDLYLSGDPDAVLPGMLPWGPPSYDQAEAILAAGRQVVQTLGRMHSLLSLAAVA